MVGSTDEDRRWFGSLRLHLSAEFIHILVHERLPRSTRPDDRAFAGNAHAREFTFDRLRARGVDFFSVHRLNSMRRFFPYPVLDLRAAFWMPFHFGGASGTWQPFDLTDRTLDDHLSFSDSANDDVVAPIRRHIGAPSAREENILPDLLD